MVFPELPDQRSRDCFLERFRFSCKRNDLEFRIEAGFSIARSEVSGGNAEILPFFVGKLSEAEKPLALFRPDQEQGASVVDRIIGAGERQGGPFAFSEISQFDEVAFFIQKRFLEAPDAGNRNAVFFCSDETHQMRIRRNRRPEQICPRDLVFSRDFKADSDFQRRIVPMHRERSREFHAGAFRRDGQTDGIAFLFRFELIGSHFVIREGGFLPIPVAVVDQVSQIQFCDGERFALI